MQLFIICDMYTRTTLHQHVISNTKGEDKVKSRTRSGSGEDKVITVRVRSSCQGEKRWVDVKHGDGDGKDGCRV